MAKNTSTHGGLFDDKTVSPRKKKKKKVDLASIHLEDDDKQWEENLKSVFPVKSFRRESVAEKLPSVDNRLDVNPETKPKK